MSVENKMRFPTFGSKKGSVADACPSGTHPTVVSKGDFRYNVVFCMCVCLASVFPYHSYAP